MEQHYNFTDELSYEDSYMCTGTTSVQGPNISLPSNETSQVNCTYFPQSNNTLVEGYTGVYLTAGAVALISLFGGVNNLMIIIVAFLSPILRRKTHVLVMNLAVIDFLVTVIFCPLYVCSLLLGAWPFSNDVCALTSLILAHNSGVSLLTNFAIAVNRCLLARGGDMARKFTQTKPIMCAVIFIWVAVFTLNVIPVLTGYVHLQFNPRYSYCAPSLILTPQSNWIIFYGYTYAIAILGPLFGSLISYFLVYRSVRGSMLMTRSDFARRRYIRTSRNLTYLFAVFCVCWLPDTIHFTFDPEGILIPVYVTRIFVVLFLFNSALNPFIFAWKFPAFRKSLKFIVFVKVMRRRGSFMSMSKSTFSAGNLSPTPSPNPPLHTFNTHTTIATAL